MKLKSILLVSTLIWGWGEFLLFHGLDALPLWLVWTVGPLCWYLGCAGMLVAGSITVHQHLAKRATKSALERELARTSELQFKKLALGNAAPAGVMREIPPMGGFVM